MSDEKKIVAIGDSITYGFPYLQCLSWVHLAGEELGLSIINKGVNGNTSSQMLERFDYDVIRQLPSHVIIMGGTNDACTRVEAEEVDNNIRYMAETALQYGITPIIGLPIPCNYPQDEYILGLYREDVREYALTNDLYVIDFYTAFLKYESKQPQVEFYADALHPNERGYKVMAGLVVKALQIFLKI
ncbi:Acyl-CoA thioesterase I precursor [Sporomusa ovata DSM 2662]|uniref:Probable tesA-like protease n=1 Tax=Sporomusa ovata TaxID=2378 RepID=A0A0U1L015_9FIRM|nr:GDSL-type esterase/lipase family protein [Sporomusa ovata]EQB27171.1 lipolytic protein G-D-S-L family [Sporomusa ovata DSM 2662]CQR73007.1 Probable tesA-like protease [Sporomusa ovata]